MTIHKLKQLQEIIKISVLAKKMGLSANTLQTKIRRNQELNTMEAFYIDKILKDDYGIEVKNESERI